MHKTEDAYNMDLKNKHLKVPEMQAVVKTLSNVLQIGFGRGTKTRIHI